MSSLNRGNYFSKRKNFYNALKEYSNAIKNEGDKTTGHFNASLTYRDLGLNKIALNQADIAVRNYKEDTYDRLVKEYELYSVRALMYELNGIFDLMQKDQDKCLEIKKTLHLSVVIQKIKVLLRTVKDEQLELYIQEIFEEFEKINHISYFLYNDFSDFKRNLHSYLCSVYEAMGDYSKAIREINSAIKLKDSVLNYHYRLGKLLFRCKNEVQAENIYKTIIQKVGETTPYRISQFQEGIIAKTNKDGTAGTILTNTIFNDWDIIEFKTKMKVEDLIIGDLVSIKLGYHIQQNIRKGITRNVKKTHSIHPKKLKKHTKFHCLINSSQNINNTVNQFYFINVFYPSSFLMSFSQIEDKLSDVQKEELLKKGFLFLEIELKYEGDSIAVVETRLISDNNQFNCMPPPKKIRSQRQTYSSGKECPICQMDEWCGTDGCPMDPQ
jgi:hypothetical protein